jgi:hypothetical protein
MDNRNTKDDLLQQALAALETCTPGDYSTGHVIHPWHDDALIDAAADAIRAHLAWPDPSGKVLTLADSLADLAGTERPAQPAHVPDPWTHCNCLWEGDIQVQQCTLHAAHVDAIHEWAERAQAAEAKLSAAPVPVPPGWMPIETAPKDGTSVLIYKPNALHKQVEEAYWVTPYEDCPEDRCWWSTPIGIAGRGYTILPNSVTHWMPLPPPPGIAASPEKKP